MSATRNPGSKARQRLSRRSFVEEFGQDSGIKLEVVPEECLIKNVCIAGPTSRNGNRYTKQALEGALSLYDHAKSYVDHPDDPKGKRRFGSRLGTFLNPRLVGGKPVGDYFYNPEHPDAPSLVWAAKNDPDFCGFSHNVETEGFEEPNGTWVVHKITKVRSVDLVAEPATTKNLQEGAMDPELDGMMDGGGDPEKHLGKLISALCADTSLTKAEKRKKVLKAIDLYDDPAPDEKVEEEDDEEMGFEKEDGGDMDGDEDDEFGDEDKLDIDLDFEKPEKEGGGDDMGMEKGDEDDEEWEKKDEEEAVCPDCGGEMKNGKCEECMGAKRVKESKKPAKGRRMKESISYARKLAHSRDPKVRLIAESLLENLSQRRTVSEAVDRRRPAKGRRRVTEDVDLSRHPDPRVRKLVERHDVMESKLDEILTERSLTKKRQFALRLCEEANLPKEAVSETFVRNLLSAPTRAVMEDLVEDRRQACGVQVPHYISTANGGDMDLKQFAKHVKQGA
jgi:hypothetical protein